MNQFKITTAGQRCDIVVGEPLQRLPKTFLKLARPGAKVAIISDAAVVQTYGKVLARGLKVAGYETFVISIPSGERSKSLAEAGRLFRWLARNGIERGSWVMALGGGVIGDLAGFVAATYLRGIFFAQVPTTLLAQVDASIGGKTAVDIPEGKNLVGTFYQPRLVWIDPALLRSLPKKHWCNGMAEVIKYGAIADRGLFERLEKNMDALMRGFSSAWAPIIARCAQIKASVVQKDPREINGHRAVLNFGHSIGHAIEAATSYRSYLHGEAISIGMFAAALVSQQLGLFDGLDRIRLGTLLTRAGLLSRVRKPIARDRLMCYLARDKKVEQGSVKFVLLKGIGQAITGQSVASEYIDAALSASGL